MQLSKYTYSQPSTRMQKSQSFFINTIYTERTEHNYNPEDDYPLLSGEGWILLTSPVVVNQPVSDFSNGNF